MWSALFSQMLLTNGRVAQQRHPVVELLLGQFCSTDETGGNTIFGGASPLKTSCSRYTCVTTTKPLPEATLVDIIINRGEIKLQMARLRTNFIAKYKVDAIP